MNRERLAWIASTLIIAALALSLPGAAAQRESDFQFTGTLGDIHRLIDTTYVEKPDDAVLKEAAINGMLKELDPFTMYFPPAKKEDFKEVFEGQLTGIGIQIHQVAPGKYEVASPIDGSPAAAADILPGDRLLEVDHKPIDDPTFDTLSKKIKGAPGTKVTLTLGRGDAKIERTVTRANVQLPTVTGYDRNADQSWNYFPIASERIAYIRVSNFNEDTAEKFVAALKQVGALAPTADLKGLVIDLRGNGGGLVEAATSMASLFLPAGAPIITTKDRSGTAKPTVAANGDKVPATIPLVLLVNGDTASASEIFSGALADNRRATLVGTRTYGKGSVQEIHDLPNDGGTLKITIAHYYLPSGRLIHRKPDSTTWGVDPTILVPVDDKTELAILQSQQSREYWRRPGTTGPTTRTTDPQLDQALQALLALQVMSGPRK